MVDLNYNFECDRIIELSDNQLSENKLSDNKLSDNKKKIVDKAVKIAWIKRLTDHDIAAWKIISEFAAWIIPTELKKLLRNQNNCSQKVISTPVPPHDPRQHEPPILFF